MIGAFRSSLKQLLIGGFHNCGKNEQHLSRHELVIIGSDPISEWAPGWSIFIYHCWLMLHANKETTIDKWNLLIKWNINHRISTKTKNSLFVFWLSHPTGSSKYGTTRKNTQRYNTAKRLIRYMYCFWATCNNKYSFVYHSHKESNF